MQPHFAPELRLRKKSPKFLNFLYNDICSHPRFWISVASFSIIPLLIISVASSIHPNRISTATATATAANSEECPSGRIYVYDLPSILNDDLLLYNCTDLNTSNWECGIATNHGLGPAAAELRRILPESFSTSWYRTNQYALEPILHHRILHHKCRTPDPKSAAAFYIPFYAGMAVGKYLYLNDTDKLDWHPEMLLRWVQQQPYWKKSNGSDHFTAIGRTTWEFRRLTNGDLTWGSTFLNKPEMQRVTRLIIERATYDDRDVGVPYPTGFHPDSGETLKRWQEFVRRYDRQSLFTFVGGAREWVNNDFRALLLTYCKNESPSCRTVDCAVEHCAADAAASLEAFLGSEFCLQPKGDTFTRRSTFDCMIAGSVPVFFWKRTTYEQYDWFLPGEPESYSVFIEHEEVRNRSSIVKEVLMRYSKEEIRRKRERVIESIPRIIYGIENGGFKGFDDAIDIALHGVLRRIKTEERME